MKEAMPATSQMDLLGYNRIRSREVYNRNILHPSPAADESMDCTCQPCHSMVPCSKKDRPLEPTGTGTRPEPENTVTTSDAHRSPGTVRCGAVWQPYACPQSTCDRQELRTGISPAQGNSVEQDGNYVISGMPHSI